MPDFVKPPGEALVLEIQNDPAPGDLVNMVVNPNGTQGGWGWVTPVAGSAMNSVPTPVGSAWDEVDSTTTWDAVASTVTWDTWGG